MEPNIFLKLGIGYHVTFGFRVRFAVRCEPSDSPPM